MKSQSDLRIKLKIAKYIQKHYSKVFPKDLRVLAIFLGSKFPNLILRKICSMHLLYIDLQMLFMQFGSFSTRYKCCGKFPKKLSCLFVCNCNDIQHDAGLSRYAYNSSVHTTIRNQQESQQDIRMPPNLASDKVGFFLSCRLVLGLCTVLTPSPRNTTTIHVPNRPFLI